MKELSEARRKALDVLDDRAWIKWIHQGTTPAYTAQEKKANVAMGKENNGKHCSICLNLNGCSFPERNMPSYPLHPGCHCETKLVPEVKVKGKCIIEKFTDYIFNYNKNKGKKSLFEDWGYDIMDSEWLKSEFIRQAEEKYADSNFKLGKLDGYGQRLSIEITLPRKNRSGTVSFISGWMVYPDGVIQLATPYGGAKK